MGTNLTPKPATVMKYVGMESFTSSNVTTTITTTETAARLTAKLRRDLCVLTTPSLPTEDPTAATPHRSSSRSSGSKKISSRMK